MKSILLLCCFLISFCCNAQNIETIDKDLIKSFSKIQNGEDDSLEIANENFEKLLLKYTATNPTTISYAFKNLVNSGLRIITSEDGLFRIYTWDDNNGGTMRSAYNVFQYKSDGKTYSKTLRISDSLEEYNIYPFYLQINDIKVGEKTYYVTQNVTVASSALYGFSVKIFSIEDGKLNDEAKLIKTKSGIKNELGYAVDWSASVNRDSNLQREISQIKYDPKNKIISIPLIQDDDKITTKRIRYKFNGRYFVKMPTQ